MAFLCGSDDDGEKNATEPPLAHQRYGRARLGQHGRLSNVAIYGQGQGLEIRGRLTVSPRLGV